MGTVYAKGVGTIVVLLLDGLSRTFTLWYAIVPHSLNNNPLISWGCLAYSYNNNVHIRQNSMETYEGREDTVFL